MSKTCHITGFHQVNDCLNEETVLTSFFEPACFLPPPISNRYILLVLVFILASGMILYIRIQYFVQYILLINSFKMKKCFFL